MKVINVTPGLLPIPPNGWGAVEKVIWDYHLQLQANNISSEIKYLNEINYDDSMIVHVHVANLANECYQKGIPYIFTIHDHHAYLHGKDSSVFKENLMAIENSVISTAPCKFFIPYFGSEKLRYFSHAVNTETFKNRNEKRTGHNLLCVANNGYAGNPSVDRKGFKIAIEAAKILDLPITIAGPANNKNFFSTLPDELNNYSKLTKVFDLDEKTLIDIYNQHSIFLHFSELEAGHPNLTLLEAMSCGLPVVGTFEESNYNGMEVTSRSLNDALRGINQVISNYDYYKKTAIENAIKNSYSNRVFDLISIYSEYREKIFAERLMNSYKNIKKNEPKNRIFISYRDGAKVEIIGSIQKIYNVSFIDNKNGRVVYDTEISNQMWTKPSIKYFTEWKIEVYEKNEDGSKTLVKSEILDLSQKRVKVVMATESIGDILAYAAVVDRFQKRHNCALDCVVLNKDLLNSFKPNYKNINFIPYNLRDDDYYATYEIGYFMDNWLEKSAVNPRETKLTHVASHILGEEHMEQRPKVSFVLKPKPNKKYVCIATQSTAQCKYWNNEKGWETLIKRLNEKGYEVWCIDRYNCFGNSSSKLNDIPVGAIDKTGNFSLEERMSQIKNAEFFIGLGSGLSWLAWAVGVPVVLISGFSKPLAEFETPYRIINENVCNGCWNDPTETFDKSNWMWCPRNKNFECTREITPEMVIDKISNLL